MKVQTETFPDYKKKISSIAEKDRKDWNEISLRSTNPSQRQYDSKSIVLHLRARTVGETIINVEIM